MNRNRKVSTGRHWNDTNATTAVAAHPRPPRRHAKKESNVPSMEEVFAQNNFWGDEAESTLIQVLEERRQRAAHDAHHTIPWSPAVEGERPPLSRYPTTTTATTTQTTTQGSSSPRWSRKKRTFVDVAQRIRQLKKHSDSLRHLGSEPSHMDWLLTDNHKSSSLLEQNHTHAAPTSSGDKTQGDGTTTSPDDGDSSQIIIQGTTDHEDATDTFFSRDDQTDAVTDPMDDEDGRSEELLPLTASTSGGQSREKRFWFASVSSAAGTTNTQYNARNNSKGPGFVWATVCEVLHVKALLHQIGSFLRHFVLFGLPCLMGAFLCFYKLGRPQPDFLPHNTSISWWLLFMARQSVTLELAILSQFFIMDALALRTKWAAKLFSPFVTLCVIQAKGWPFVITWWGIWDLFLLHGQNNFQRNWLYQLGWDIFSPNNPGGQVLSSPFYLQVLLAGMCAGMAHSIKRTVLALYFGRRTFLNYRPRLLKILQDMVLITEIAELSWLGEKLDPLATSLRHNSSTPSKGTSIRASMQWKNLRFKQNYQSMGGISETTEFEVEDSDDKDPEQDDDDLSDSDEEADSKVIVGETADDDVDDEEERSESPDLLGNSPPPLLEPLLGQPQQDTRANSYKKSEGGDSSASFNNDIEIDTASSTRSSKSSARTHSIKSLLDAWQEPVNKLDIKTEAVSIGDILKFRKALIFMDETHPFSDSFGPANDRNECIKSAQATYHRLLAMTNRDVLPFNVIGLLAADENGQVDETKQKNLKRLFRPDRFEELSLVAFVQSCDNIYKRLRFFRASVGNASVIDKMLERIFDLFFNFCLLIVILTLLQIDPWPLVVSTSSLVVSFAFAFGPSASRLIEGILLIAVRRPFDLGDRIMFIQAESIMPHTTSTSWFVEDITMFTTSLRYASTNEMATVNNGSIALSRIVNCAKSLNAMVTIKVQFELESEEESIGLYRSALAKFIHDRPRIWDSLVFFRVDNIDTDQGCLEYLIRIKHMRTWQDSAKIMMNRAEVMKFGYETGKKLGINYLGGVIPSLRILSGEEETDTSNANARDALTLLGL